LGPPSEVADGLEERRDENAQYVESDLVEVAGFNRCALVGSLHHTLGRLAIMVGRPADAYEGFCMA
jgi:hypothetical protein